MKKLFLLIAALACLTSAFADSAVSTLTANTAANILATPKAIDSITVTATTTNITTVRFYDSSTTSTTLVQAAYQRWASYQTNYSTVFTNEANLLVTNTFRGTWTYPTSVSVATNARPAILTLIIPASSQRTKIGNLLTIQGLTAQANQDAIVEVDYKANQ